jgi:hypothetical protein
MVVLNSLGTPFADALTTKGLQGRRAWVYVVALAIGAALFAGLAATNGAKGAAIAAIATQSLLSAGLIVVNPSGFALLAAAVQRALLPVCAASASVYLLHSVLPDALISAAICFAAYCFVAIVSDLELRNAVSKVGAILYAQCLKERAA